MRGLWVAAGMLSGLLLISLPIEAQQPQNPATAGQQDQAAQPIPAYHSPYTPASADDNTSDGSQGQSIDNRPLSGAQYMSAGNITNNRTYWQPRFNISGTGDSNPAEGAANTSTWGTWVSFMAGADVHHRSGTSDMALSYTGGEMRSNETGVASGTVQELGFTEKLSLRRSVLSVFDQLSYLPQASFGFGGIGTLPIGGAGSTSLGPGFSTGQSILTGQGQNLTNSSVLQLETFLTPRSSITMAGAYSLQHYFANGLINSGSITFQGGYNYALTRQDTVAAIYAYNDFRYSSLSESVYSHSIEASYGRTITGRLAVQASGGPEIVVFNVGSGPAGGTGGTSGASNFSTTKAYWTLNSALNYEYQRMSLGLTYWHGVGAGSGVLAGSSTDMVSGALTRQMSRLFTSGLSAGFSRNSALPALSGPIPAQSFDYWFAGANLEHPISETLAFTFAYQMQYQTTSSSFCIANSCGTSFIRHLITVGLSWHQRPLLF
ncbi:MAG TPA: hypothetical protein VJQ82_04385 [Terriglobales bacterium]|nr:hypothetical protein [Terriglobales bacterium]